MKTQIVKPQLSAGLGLLLTAPTAYFFLINILNALGMPGLYDASNSIFESLGSNQSLGWNINLLILLGPIIALLLNLTSILSFTWASTKTDLNVEVNLQKRWNNWLVIGFSGLCLLSLFIYLFAENCH